MEAKAGHVSGSGGAGLSSVRNVETVWIESGAARLSCSVVGEGPPIVFLHAGVSDRRSWTQVQRELADSYTTVAYDRRGFGDTVYQPELFDSLADLRAVMDGTVGGRACLVGNSMGARLALDFALEELWRVAALVLMGPAVSGAPPPTNLPAIVESLDAAIEAAEEAGDMVEANRLEAWLWLDGPLCPQGRVSGAVRELFLDMNDRALRATPTGGDVERVSAWDLLEEVVTPTLVLGGTFDLPHVVDRQAVLVDRIPGARLLEIEGTAHLPGLEKPGRVAQIIRDFLT